MPRWLRLRARAAPGWCAVRDVRSAACARRIVPLQFPQAQAKALGIKRADGERAHAALRTSRTAAGPGAALARSLSQRGIHDLNQGPIADHASRIADNRDSGSRKNTVA